MTTKSSRRGLRGGPEWPLWTDRLVPSSGDVADGGRRTNGELRTGTADRPLVSYVTVVKDNVSTLRRAIESVQQQTYRNVEHVILDGASTDGTLDVIGQYADRVDYFASEPDTGLYDALDKAIPLARGDLICALNSDDWLEPSAAETAVSHLPDVEAPTILLTAAIARRTWARTARPAGVLKWYPAIVHPGCYFTCADYCHNGVYATRSAYERSGPYDTTYEIAGDFTWIMACLDSGVDFVYTRDITVNYVMGGVSSDTERHALECVRAMCERFPSLTHEEAGGLHHCFFRFPTASSVPGRPDDVSDFLRRVLTSHSDERELLRSIAWALLMSSDPVHPSAQVLVKEFVRLGLRDRPRLLRIAHRLYAGKQRG